MSSFRQSIPSMGYGTWNRSGDEAYAGVSDAIELGYRHIDTAQAYANEKEVGAAIQASGISREAVFITTKVDPVNFAPNCVKPSVEKSLADLQVEQVDLLLLHFPSLHDEYQAQDYISQLGEAYEAGYAKYVGVSNFTRVYLDTAIDVLGRDAIVNNQIEIHAYMQNKPIVYYCKQLGISTTAYSPLARGALINDTVLCQIAENHSASSGQIALAFLLAEGHIVIPSSTNKWRSQQNLASTDIHLSKQEILAIRKLERGLRLVDEDWCPQWDV
ncbi:aldo/keto reductase [Agaribacter flavus]|uniref:Aldo/keto reductase n=1 Tax=Agaribacter flavus TaxID=1902781 RepID=A0ABV7FLZ1_9ALTE